MWFEGVNVGQDSSAKQVANLWELNHVMQHWVVSCFRCGNFLATGVDNMNCQRAGTSFGLDL